MDWNANNPLSEKERNHREHQDALLELLEAFADLCEELGLRYMLYAGTMLGAVRHNGFIPWDDDIDVIMPRESYEKFLQLAPGVMDRDRFYLQGEYSAHWPFYFSKLRLNHTASMEKYIPRDEQMHQGIFMDIFPYDDLPDGEIQRKLRFFASRIVIAKGLQQRGYAAGSRAKKLAMLVSLAFPARAIHRFVTKRRKYRTESIHTFFAAGSRYEKAIFPRDWFETCIPMEFEGRCYPVSAHYDELLTRLYGDYRQLPTERERQCKVHNLLVDVHRSYTEYIGYQKTHKIDVPYKSIR